MQIEERVIGILNEKRDRIRSRMEERRINATGRTSLSLRVRKEGTIIQLVGGGDSSKWGGKTAPFETIEIGRGPGGEYKEIRGSIYYWTIAKGMSFDNDSHRWAVATNIAKNIVEHGTIRHREHEDIYTTDVRDVADKIRRELFNDVRAELIAAVASVNVKTDTNTL